MKHRNTLLLTVLLFMVTVGMTSCVRDYICQCEIKYSGQPGLPDSSMRSYTVRDTKKNARSLCEQNSFTHEDGDIKSDEVCQLY